MEDVLATIGIDFRMVLFSVINFLVFFLVLQKFVLKKLGASLANRQAMIEESQRNAAQLKVELEEARETSLKIIAAANQQASDIVEKYQTEAEKLAAQIKQQAEDSIASFEQESRKLMEAERNELLKNTRKELADVVIDAATKLISTKINEDEDKKLILKFLDTIESNQK